MNLKELDKKLSDAADLVLKEHNPCKIKDGVCMWGDLWCCSDTRFKSGIVTRKDGRYNCKYLGTNGCTNPNVECKVWLCDYCKERADKKCLKSLRHLEEIAIDYGIIKE